MNGLFNNPNTKHNFKIMKQLFSTLLGILLVAGIMAMGDPHPPTVSDDCQLSEQLMVTPQLQVENEFQNVELGTVEVFGECLTLVRQHRRLSEYRNFTFNSTFEYLDNDYLRMMLLNPDPGNLLHKDLANSRDNRSTLLLVSRNSLVS